MGALGDLLDWTAEHDALHEYRDPALAELMRRQNKRVNALVEVCRGVLFLVLVTWAALALVAAAVAVR